MLASLRLLRCPSLARLAPPLTRSLSKTSTKPPNMAGTLSSKTTKSGEAFKDLRPLVPREPEVDEETGFDSDTAENWIMFPTKEAVREGIFKDYLKLTEELRKNHPGDERVDDTQVSERKDGAHIHVHKLDTRTHIWPRILYSRIHPYPLPLCSHVCVAHTCVVRRRSLQLERTTGFTGAA